MNWTRNSLVVDRLHGVVRVGIGCLMGYLIIATPPCWGLDGGVDSFSNGTATQLTVTRSEGGAANGTSGEIRASGANETSRIDVKGTPLPGRDSLSSPSPTIPGGLGSLVRTVVILGAMIALLLLANRWLRRKFAGQIVPRLPEGMVELLGRAPFLARQSVVLVRVGPRLLWVAMTPNGPVTLTQFDDPEQIRQILELIPGKRRSSESGRRTARTDASEDTVNDGMTELPTATSFETEYQRAMRSVRQRAVRESEPPLKGGER